jgi:TIR domain
LEVKKQQQLPGEENMQIVASEIKEMAQKEKNETNLLVDLVTPASDSREQPGNYIAPPIPMYPGFVTAPADMPQPPPAVVSVENKTVPDTKCAQEVSSADVSGDKQYDYFVSYAHKHAEIVDVFVNNLSTANGNLKIFYDKNSIPAGGLWIKQISDAIQKAKKVLIFLSPDYSNSPVCWDEFQCAKLMEYNSKKQIIQTIYLYNDIAMPPIMGIYSWADCREGDKDKLQKIAEAFCENLA